jgi:hypothetical protein
MIFRQTFSLPAEDRCERLGCVLFGLPPFRRDRFLIGRCSGDSLRDDRGRLPRQALELADVGSRMQSISVIRVAGNPLISA